MRTPREIILQRRKQMAVHSCLYYMMDENIVSDDTWQQWADELQQLQENHPECMKMGFMDTEFHDWTGATGAHLNHRHPWTYTKALRLLEYHNRVNKSVNNHLYSLGMSTKVYIIAGFVNGSVNRSVVPKQQQRRLFLTYGVVPV